MNKTWHQNAIALTGIIGSGKSAVANFLSELGAFVLSADQLAREVVTPGSEGLEQIVEAFGEGILDASGSLDRKKMAAQVFSSPEKKAKLESITHPLIRALGATKFEAAYQQDYPLYVYEIPLLFESGLDKIQWKKIVVVSAPEDDCLARIMQRDNISLECARARMKVQIPLEKKIQAADVVISNDGTLSELKKKTSALFRSLTNS